MAEERETAETRVQSCAEEQTCLCCLEGHQGCDYVIQRAQAWSTVLRHVDSERQNVCIPLVWATISNTWTICVTKWLVTTSATYTARDGGDACSHNMCMALATACQHCFYINFPFQVMSGNRLVVCLFGHSFVKRLCHWSGRRGELVVQTLGLR